MDAYLHKKLFLSLVREVSFLATSLKACHRRRLRRRLNLGGLWFFFAFLPISTTQAEVGVYTDRILFGQSAALEGPTSFLGNSMREGILAAFEEVNRQGGVHGRHLDLITYDDGYEPNKAIRNTKILIRTDKVFALVGAVGTPTARAGQAVAQEENVPFIGAMTGVSSLREPSLKNVVNIRASYDQEAEKMLAYLTEVLGITRLAVIYQDDSFGQAGLEAVKKALQHHNLELVAEGTYRRNTTAVKRTVLQIRRAAPQAVIIVGTYKPVAEVVHVARKLGLQSFFLSLSFVDGRALAIELGTDREGMIVSQVVPLYKDLTIPVVRRFQAALHAFSPQSSGSFVALEGYIVGRLIIETLANLGQDVTRTSFLKAIETQRIIEIDEFNLTYGPNDNQGSDAVFLTRIRHDGEFELLRVPETSD